MRIFKWRYLGERSWEFRREIRVRSVYFETIRTWILVEKREKENNPESVWSEKRAKNIAFVNIL